MFQKTKANSVASEVASHIRLQGSQYSAWYVGISKDPDDRLLTGHNATSKRNAARSWDAGTADNARAIERHFLDQGCKGSWGGGDNTAKYVYVYKVDTLTIE